MILLRQINNQNFALRSLFNNKQVYDFSSKHRVHEIKNNSMLIIEDLDHKLPYMAEVQLLNGSKGVVMKIQQGGNAYLGMYEQVSTGGGKIKQVQISRIHRSWKASTTQLSKKIVQQPSGQLGIYDINNNNIQRNTAPAQKQQQERYQILNGNKRRLKTSSPILNACNDLYYGDMITFMGCRGSRKSQNGWDISREFSDLGQSSLAIYVNPYIKEARQLAKKNSQSIAFTVPQGRKPTDVGVYMLTLKAINLSIQLKKQGFNILLIVDNLNDIMLRQWSMLQSIKFNSKLADSSKLFQYNTLKISPVSILNEIYSGCQDINDYCSGSSPLRTSKKGSMTSILITQKQNNQLVQQTTSYSNNLKHLQTLSQVIDYPLSFKINTNTYYQKPRSQQQHQKIQQQRGYNQKQLYRFLRSYVNKFIRQKQQTQLKRQLYRTDVRDAPWDYFFLLDAEWWVNGIKDVSNSINSYKQATQFLKWLIFNIEHDHIGHWNISAKQSYNKFLTYIKSQHNLAQETTSSKIDFQVQDMQAFVDDAKMQELISPFKKDYLI